MRYHASTVFETIINRARGNRKTLKRIQNDVKILGFFNNLAINEIPMTFDFRKDFLPQNCICLVSNAITNSDSYQFWKN